MFVDSIDRQRLDEVEWSLALVLSSEELAGVPGNFLFLSSARDSCLTQNFSISSHRVLQTRSSKLHVDKRDRSKTEIGSSMQIQRLGLFASCNYSGHSASGTRRHPRVDFTSCQALRGQGKLFLPMVIDPFVLITFS